MSFTLRGARLLDATTEHLSGDITIERTRIQAVGHAPAALAGDVIDATGMIITPGFIDVHTHGGGGFHLHTTDAEEICSYARWAPTTGATSFLVGVVGVPDDIPEAQLLAAVEAIEHHEDLGAEPLGIHLEGPYISAAHKGAHMLSWLRKPDPAETERILALTRGHLRLVTLAPELPGAADMIRRLVGTGITVSLGHSDATYGQALEAFGLGVTHMTHCFNAMRPLLHRAPGPLGAITENTRVQGELIADGVHVHPAAMKVLVRALRPERTVVVTDATSAAGIPDATLEFAGQKARVIDGAARLANGTLTGSVLTMDLALRNLLSMVGVTLQEAVRMLTLNPAQSARAADHKGRLLAGYDADLLIFDSSLALQATFCRGRVTFATGAWRSRLPD